MKTLRSLLLGLATVTLGCSGDGDVIATGGAGGSSHPSDTATGSGSTASASSSQASTSSASTSSTGGQSCTPGVSESCYTGAPSTLGVGPCTSGMHTCAADGLGFGPCMGEVLPTTDPCLTGADENCDGSTPSCAGWVNTFTGADYESVRALVALPTGGVIVAGAFDGHFAAASTDSNGLDDIFLEELDAQGNVVWLNTFGGAGNDEPIGLAVDSAGRIVLGGIYNGNVTIGPIALPPPYGKFVATFQPNGVPIAAHGFPGTAPYIGDVGVDAAGEIALTGYQTGVFDWGGGPIDGKEQSVVIVRLHKDLQFASATLLQELHAFPFVMAAAVAPNGDVALTSTFSSSIELGMGSVGAVGFDDLFFQRVGANSAPIWGHAWGTVNMDAGQAIAIDGPDVVVGGVFGGPINLGGMSNPLTGSTFITRLDATGTASWATSFFNAGNSTIEGIAIAPSHHVFVLGHGDSTITIGTTTLDLGASGARTYLAELDQNGVPLAAKKITSGPNFGLGHALAVGPNGEIYLGGAFQSTVEGPNGPVMSTGGYDGFVYKIVP